MNERIEKGRLKNRKEKNNACTIAIYRNVRQTRNKKAQDSKTSAEIQE